MDEEYFIMIDGSEQRNPDGKASAEKAFCFANKNRLFEIENFWKRATYYWAYITGAVVAYSFVLIHCATDKTKIDLTCLYTLPLFNKLVLCLLAFLVFFFCLAWVLVNKGSKFWQTTWEAHVAELENSVIGKVYKTHLDTNENNFCFCPFMTSGYRYSVSALTTLCSIVVMVLTGLLFGFHIALLFTHINLLLGIVVALMIIGLSIYFICTKTKFPEGKGKMTKHYYWKQVENIL